MATCQCRELKQQQHPSSDGLYSATFCIDHYALFTLRASRPDNKCEIEELRLESSVGKRISAPRTALRVEDGTTPYIAT